IKTTAAATATAAVATSARAQDAPADGLIHRNERGGMPYCKLGRTNFLCSRLVFGGGAALMGGKAVRLLNAAFDAGVTFYDLGSHAYYKGSERAFAPFRAEHRGKIWVTSKAPLRPVDGHEPGNPLTVAQGRFLADYWTGLLDASLADLGTDYVDAYYLMGVGDPELVRCEQLHEAFLQAERPRKVGREGGPLGREHPQAGGASARGHDRDGLVRPRHDRHHPRRVVRLGFEESPSRHAGDGRASAHAAARPGRRHRSRRHEGRPLL